jgi:hypothetical protein
MLKIIKTATGPIFRVRVQPGAGKNEIVGVQQDPLKIRISAPPVLLLTVREMRNLIFLIFPTETRFGSAKAKVEVQKHLDKTIHVFYKGEVPSKLIIPVEDEQLCVPSQKRALLAGV